MPNLPAYTTSLGNPTGYARTIASKIIRDLHQNQQILLANSEDLLYFCHNRRTDGSTIVVKTSKMVCTLENAEAFWKQALADFKNTSSSIAHGIEDFYVYGETHYDLHELPTANAHSDECWLVYKHEDMKRVDIADFGSWSSFIIEGQTSFYDIEIPLDWKQWTKK